MAAAAAAAQTPTLISPTVDLPHQKALGVSTSQILQADAEQVAAAWLKVFASKVSKNDVDGILSLLAPDAWWRDLLAMTWDLRTFQGQASIKQFLSDRLAQSELSDFQLTSAAVDKLYDDLAWVRLHFTFETKAGSGVGVVRLVPVRTGNAAEWKAHHVCTNLEELRGFPERTGPLRDFAPNHGKWVEKRDKEKALDTEDPQVLVVGGGHSGLDIAARLKLLGVRVLICEKNPRIGDNWRHRYSALCLHDVVWYDHMPYLPFPPSWPVYTPAMKIAGWLEQYADSMELDYWTEAKVVNARRVPNANEGNKEKWEVTVRRGDVDKVFHVDHVVFAVGFGGYTPNMPKIPGMDEFEGQILHSTQHKNALDHKGKKVAVVGACTSAHDIAADYYDHGVDVTMVQRSSTYIMTNEKGWPILMKGTYWEGGPPVEQCDLIDLSMPILYRKMIHKRITQDIAKADKEILDGLHNRGFKTNMGPEGSGHSIMAMIKGGGYYLDVGASQMIVDGKIKVKSSGPIKRFTKNTLVFEDGSELAVDVVVFASGFGDSRVPMREIVEPDVGKRLHPIWNLDHEGETRGAWKEIGVENLWCMMGNFAWCRFYSKRLALQIKAKLEGILKSEDRYSAPIKWEDEEMNLIPIV
ncbi:uncharacterized protein PHACADRAFT_144909 [Phanerochaete carnosa HHB-10118-sp]|uniref:FAD/NAD(P)-binding domain-containing protein n=1 Tax=Phanerochaete carnosa (strain HHB-10118-sp) TaxID=650164 RepID=K5VWM7_PHACS|nr:uncharacterized protein PHACADRAFT_144909 [Phanerochaete carnosa HHB-10118-sp]EKM55953.1 hypothetical protein PHACADRAFT_144909 [Phanerochaete carnosa HHB-10118-sp]